MNLRLLERIRNAQHGLGAIDSGNSEALTASLERHLTLILNTHQGSSASAKDFGMPDFLSLSSQSDLDNIRELTRILTEVIKKYEPRLLNASVTHIPGGSETGTINFALSGSVMLNNEKKGIFFSTAITPDGQVNVHK